MPTIYDRVSSTYSSQIYKELINVSNHMDFSLPMFWNRRKRNRSLGSAQALIVELALTDDYFLDKLRQFMVKNGEDWTPLTDYREGYGHKKTPYRNR